MKHFLAILAAFVLSGTVLTATAHAQAPGYYTAVAVDAPHKASMVTRTAIWSCDGATCVAQKAPERDAVLCALVAQRVGKLASFTVAGQAYDAASLEKCNARAK